MHLTPHEQERLLVSYAAELALRRRARGLRLNHPEAVAVVTSYVLEGSRDGRTVAELMSAGREVLSRDDLLDGVAELVEFALRLAERYAVMEGGLISHSGSTDSVDLTSFSELLAI